MFTIIHDRKIHKHFKIKFNDIQEAELSGIHFNMNNRYNFYLDIQICITQLTLEYPDFQNPNFLGFKSFFLNIAQIYISRYFSECN